MNRMEMCDRAERIQRALLDDILGIIRAGHRRPEIIALGYRVRKAPKYNLPIMMAYRDTVERTIGQYITKEG